MALTSLVYTRDNQTITEHLQGHLPVSRLGCNLGGPLLDLPSQAPFPPWSLPGQPTNPPPALLSVPQSLLTEDLPLSSSSLSHRTPLGLAAHLQPLTGVSDQVRTGTFPPAVPLPSQD